MKRTYFRKIIFAITFLFFVFGLFFGYRRLAERQENNESAVFQKGGEVLGEEGDADVPASDNFKMPLFSFGGEKTFFAETGQMGNLKIFDPESQIVRTKDKKETELIVKWKTTKPAKCALGFSKSGGQEKTVEEKNFVVEHQAVLKQLEAAATYNYVIEARDRIGGSVKSDKFVFYTGAPELSLLDMLGGAFRDVFGWAMKK